MREPVCVRVQYVWDVIDCVCVCKASCVLATEHTLQKYQRRDTGQKPKHILFCIKGAAIHTSLHQIGPNLALN